MRKSLGVLTLLAAFIGQTFAQQGFSGEMELAFGYVRTPSGEMKSVKGLKLPYTGIPVPTRKVGDPLSFFQRGWNIQQTAMQTVYMADAGSGYGYIELNPSSLDDITLSPSGVNAPWRHLTVGMQVGTPHKYLIRWIIFDRFVSGHGAGVSAFEDVIADFGGHFEPAQSGGLKVTFDISVMGITPTDDRIFLAQQYRSPQNPEMGEGPFDGDVSAIFNPIAPPSIGQSDNSFYYDWDPEPNGIYDELEVDHFGEGNFANFLLEIKADVGGSTETLPPFSYTITAGGNGGGGLADLWFSDNSYVTVTPLVTRSRTSPNGRVELESQAPTTGITSMRFQVESAAGISGVRQRIELWNYNTSQWVSFSFAPLSPLDSLVEVIVTANPQHYVNPSDRKVRARLTVSSGPATPWQYKIDQARWLVGVP